MFKNLFISILFLVFSHTAISSDVMDEIGQIQKQWALIKYQYDDDAKSAAYEKLISTTNALVEAYPERAEPLVWSAIVYSSYAGAVGGIKSITKALPAVKKARALLLKAEGIDGGVLDGSVMTTLGALYYQVPGWPLGFGDRKIARNYLKKAVEVSENGLDANFFYGDFLIDRKLYLEAIPVLEKALAAPPIKDRPIADQGRREAARELLKLAKSKIS